MGVLPLASDESRRSVQTVSCPEVDPDAAGPGVAPLPGSVLVLAPEGFEVHAPGRNLGSESVEGGTAWRFEAERPTVLSVFAARRVRRGTELGDARVVTLLRGEHPHLGEDIAREMRRILETYAALWGPIGARTPGVCEIDCRGDRHNGAAQGIVTIDRYAFDQRVPVAQPAHEIAHLWWAQEVVATGRGERFLTESQAEYAAWRHRAAADSEEAARDAADEARGRWLVAVDEHGSDHALAEVNFSTPGCSALAYAQGPLVLFAIEHRTGRAALDALLRDHRSSSAGGATLAGFLDTLSQHAGDPAWIAPWIERAGHAHLTWIPWKSAKAACRGRDPRASSRGLRRARSCRGGGRRALAGKVRDPPGRASGAARRPRGGVVPGAVARRARPARARAGRTRGALHLGPARLVPTEPVEGARGARSGR